jgi:hypothetical protein
MINPNQQNTIPISSSAPVTTGSNFKDLLRLRETVDNTERYI